MYSGRLTRGNSLAASRQCSEAAPRAPQGYPASHHLPAPRDALAGFLGAGVLEGQDGVYVDVQGYCIAAHSQPIAASSSPAASP